MYQFSDEVVCERWIENTYYQYFCGEIFFEKLLQEILRIAFISKALKTNQLKSIVVDTTVQPKAVGFPANAGLMRKTITSLVDLAKKNNINLRQTYERVVKRSASKSGAIATPNK